MLNHLSISRCLFVLLFILSAGLSSQLLAAEEPVNINTATASEIASALKGIGEKRAQAIIAYRDANGDFASLEDLLAVKGVGEAILEKNSGRIKLQ